MKLNWSFFPQTDNAPKDLIDVVKIFEKNFEKINSKTKDTNESRQNSNKILNIVEQDLIEAGYEVEQGKRSDQKISVPVLFGNQGAVVKTFEVDGWNKNKKIVIEVEAGRAIDNYQFLKDIFEASVMNDVDYLIVAVRNSYKGRSDYKKILDWINIVYLSKKIKFDLKGILLIGY